MAKMTERLAYRIAGIAWTAIYAQLCKPAAIGRDTAPELLVAA